MANFIYNHVTIEGDSDTIALLFQACKSERSDFDLGLFYDRDCTFDVTISSDRVSFVTKWTYPKQSLFLLSGQYPGLNIHCEWYEEAFGSAGSAFFENGALQKEEVEYHNYFYSCKENSLIHRLNQKYNSDYRDILADMGGLLLYYLDL